MCKKLNNTKMKNYSIVFTKSIFIISFIFINQICISQNVGIGSESFTPDQSAVLELKSTEQGFLPPRMTSLQRDAIQNPSIGLVIYNIDEDCIEIRKSDGWFNLCAGTDPCAGSISLSAPSTSIHITTPTQITWNWNTVSETMGYKYNTLNNYGTAIDNGNTTTYTQTNLECETQYNLYVWAYNACGNSVSNILSVSTSACPGPCDGITPPAKTGGGTYSIVGIGNQCWFAENLREPHANSWCYNNDCATYEETYGRFYTWSSAQASCPSGWHLPTDAEWVQMEEFLGMCSGSESPCSGSTSWRGTNEGAKLKSASLWSSPNNCGETTCNYSGFNALPGGRNAFDGSFMAIGTHGMWWTATAYDSNSAWYRTLHHSQSGISRTYYDKVDRYMVRCIKN